MLAAADQNMCPSAAGSAFTIEGFWNRNRMSEVAPVLLQTRVLLLQGGGGAAAAGAAAGAGSEMDLASILATFPPDVREEVLLTSEEDVINSLPPALLAEAQQLRQRVMQHYRYVLPCDVFVSSWWHKTLWAQQWFRYADCTHH